MSMKKVREILEKPFMSPNDKIAWLKLVTGVKMTSSEAERVGVLDEHPVLGKVKREKKTVDKTKGVIKRSLCDGDVKNWKIDDYTAWYFKEFRDVFNSSSPESFLQVKIGIPSIIQKITESANGSPAEEMVRDYISWIIRKDWGGVSSGTMHSARMLSIWLTERRTMTTSGVKIRRKKTGNVSEEEFHGTK